MIQSNIFSQCSTFDGNPPQPLITISKLKELHQSNSKSAIQEIRDFLIFYTTGRITHGGEACGELRALNYVDR